MIFLVTNDVGGTADSAAVWCERLGWAFGLIADDREERLAAVRHQIAARGLAHDAWARANTLWQVTLPLGSEQYREPGFARAREVESAARSRVLPDGLWNRPYGSDIRRWPGLPYALLFLEWEARHPREWTTHAKAWGTKESLLKELAVPGHDDAVTTKLSDLVMLAVRRPYRCKDREYVRVARAVDSPGLRDRLADAAASVDPWARTHAQYVLWVLDQPGMRIRRRTWTDWLTGGRQASTAKD